MDPVPEEWTVMAAVPPTKQPCRLCYYETTDTIEIFCKKSNELEYPAKIRKYLYLEVLAEDDQPKAICWMCSQHLETFHKFYEKINEIQRSMLLERYATVALRPIYTADARKLETIESDQRKSNADDDAFVEPAEHCDESGKDYVASSGQTIFDETTGEFHVGAEETEEYTHEDILLSPAEPTTEVNTKCEAPENEVRTRRTRSSRHKSIDSKTAVTSTDIVLSKEKEQLVKTESSTSIYGGTVENHSDDIAAATEKIEEITPKRARGRSKGSLNKKSASNKKCLQIELDSSSTKLKPKQSGSPDKSEIMTTPPKKRGRKSQGSLSASKVLSKHRDLPMHDIEDDRNDDEGQSDNEFPARDSDNDDWPAQQTLDDFPKKIIENGLLLVKGKTLMTMICKFYKLRCAVCKDSQTRFKTLRELFAHYEADHDQVGYVDCCQTKFSRYPAIIMHMARHLQPEAFKCTVCGYMVTRPRFLQSHVQTHLPEAERPYGCEECPRRFCWKGALQIHTISHQPADERKLYVCHVCGKFYDTPGGLSTHKKLIHSGKKSGSNVCHVCAKKFATRTGLNEHMTTIHVPREKDQLQCTECGKWLMNQRCLKSHMVLHSTVAFNCDICEYTTKKMILLKRHLLTQHSDDKPFSCDECGKTFKLKRALTVHVAQHNSSKTYQCTFCDRVFNSSTNFYTHRKNLHPDELQEMKNRAAEVQRLKRVRAGVEAVRHAAPTTTTTTIDTTSDMKSETNETEDDYGEYIISDAIPDDENDEIEMIPVKEDEMHDLSYIDDSEVMIGGGSSSTVMVDENATMLSTLIAGDYETIETCEVITGDDGNGHVLVNIQIENVYEE